MILCREGERLGEEREKDWDKREKRGRKIGGKRGKD